MFISHRGQEVFFHFVHQNSATYFHFLLLWISLPNIRKDGSLIFFHSVDFKFVLGKIPIVHISIESNWAYITRHVNIPLGPYGSMLPVTLKQFTVAVPRYTVWHSPSYFISKGLSQYKHWYYMASDPYRSLKWSGSVTLLLMALFDVFWRTHCQPLIVNG